MARDETRFRAECQTRGVFKTPRVWDGPVALVAVSRPGSNLALKVLGSLPSARAFLPDRFAEGQGVDVEAWQGSLGDLIGGLFSSYGSLVVFGSAGMTVRLIAPHLKHKRTDPAVVVVDDAGRFAVSLLSGHAGGANALAETVADLLGAQAVVTTGSDALGTLAVDLLGREFGWRIETPEQVTRVSAAVVNGDPVGLFQDAGETDWWGGDAPLPDNLFLCASLDELVSSNARAALVITDRSLDRWRGLLPPAVIYRPRSLVVGVGCNRGVSREEVADAISSALDANGLARASLWCLATVDMKRDEAGLLACAEQFGLPIRFFTAEELQTVTAAPNPSAVVERWIGSPGVCEPAALLASGASALLVPKMKTENVTVAVASAKLAAGEE